MDEEKRDLEKADSIELTHEEARPFLLHVEDDAPAEKVVEKDPPKTGLSRRFWICAIINTVATVGIVFVNKRIFEDAKLRHAQVAFAAFHFTVTYVLLFVLSRPQIGLFEAKSVGKLTILPFAMAMIFNVVLPNASLAYSSIEFYQIARVLVTPCIVMLNYALYRLTITRQAAITLAPICVGVAVVSYFDTKPSGDLKSTSPLGVFFALGGVLVSGLYNIWIGRYHKSLELSSWQLLMNQAPVCVLVMLYIIPFSDDVTAFHSTALPSWILILLSGVFACLINLTHYFIVNEAGAVSASVVGHCKTCIIIIVGWIVRRKPVKDGSMIGIVMAVGGAIAWVTLLCRENILRRAVLCDTANSVRYTYVKERPARS